MSFLSRFGWSPWSLSNITPPWGPRPSIYRHITAHIREAGPGLAAGGEELSDESRVRADNQLAWVPGAMDGVFSHHLGPAEASEVAGAVFDALEAPA